MKIPPASFEVTFENGQAVFAPAATVGADETIAVICANLTVPLIFHDNWTGPCADCGQALQSRPDHPPHAIKLCFRCAAMREDG